MGCLTYYLSGSIPENDAGINKRSSYDERRAEILETAARLFKEKGYHAVTVEEIATELGLSKGSLYYYVESKEDLLLQCHRAAVDPLLEEAEAIAGTDKSPEAKFSAFIRCHVSRLIDDIYVAPIILHHLDSVPPAVHEVMVNDRRRYDNILKRILNEGINQGAFRYQNTTLTAYLILGALNWISIWYSNSGSMDPAAIADFMADNFLAMFK